MGANYTKRGWRIISIMMPILFINFFSFVVGAFILGGAEDGRYFVGGNGQIAEVSHLLWVYSSVHFDCVIVTFIVVNAILFWLRFSGDMEFLGF